MKLVLLGSGAYALPTFQRLADRHEIGLVVTQPDRPAGRGQRTTPTPVGEWAEAAGLPLLKTDDVSGADRERVRSIESDAWVIIAFGQKLSPELIEDRFAINLHASLLPRWRGAAPIHHAILAGDHVTGNSVITIADRMDAGLILGQTEREIRPDDTVSDLHDRLAADGPELVESVLERHASKTLEPVPQDETKVTRAGKLGKKADGWVDFEATANEVQRRINGLSPWPGVTADFKGESVRLLRAETSKAEKGEGPAGEVVDTETGLVRCGRGGVRILEIQPPNKPVMPWSMFVQSRAVKAGDRFEGGPPC